MTLNTTSNDKLIETLRALEDRFLALPESKTAATKAYTDERDAVHQAVIKAHTAVCVSRDWTQGGTDSTAKRLAVNVIIAMMNELTARKERGE